MIGVAALRRYPIVAFTFVVVNVIDFVLRQGSHL